MAQFIDIHCLYCVSLQYLAAHPGHPWFLLTQLLEGVVVAVVALLVVAVVVGADVAGVVLGVVVPVVISKENYYYCYIVNEGSCKKKKKYFINGSAIKAFTPPPLKEF